MKNVIAMIGSLRKDSYNRAIFNKYKTISKDIFKLEEVEQADIPLYNQDVNSEPQQITKMAEAIKSADGVIFFSPEYNYSVPGLLKNSIDWLSRNPMKPFDGKASAIIGASPGQLGTARMQYHLRQIGVFLNLRFLNRPEVMISRCQDKISEGVLTDEETIAFLTKHVQQFNEFMDS